MSNAFDPKSLVKFEREDVSNGVYRGDFYAPQVGNRYDDYLGDFETPEENEDYAYFHFGILKDVKIIRVDAANIRFVITSETGGQLFMEGSRRSRVVRQSENRLVANEGRPILVLLSTSADGEDNELSDYEFHAVHNDKRAITAKRHGVIDSKSDDIELKPAPTYQAEDMLSVDWDQLDQLLGYGRVSEIVEELHQLGGDEGIFDQKSLETFQNNVLRELERAKEKQEAARRHRVPAFVMKRRRENKDNNPYRWEDFGPIATAGYVNFRPKEQALFGVGHKSIELHPSRDGLEKRRFGGTEEEFQLFVEKVDKAGQEPVFLCLDRDDLVVDLVAASDARLTLRTQLNMVALDLEDRTQQYKVRHSTLKMERELAQSGLKTMTDLHDMSLAGFRSEKRQLERNFQTELRKLEQKQARHERQHAERLEPHKEKLRAIENETAALQVIKNQVPELKTRLDRETDKYISFTDTIGRELEVRRRLETSIVAKAPKIAAEWHPTANGNLLPRHTSVFSRKPVHWLCPENGHEYVTSPFMRVQKGRGCPQCKKDAKPESEPVSYTTKQARARMKKIGTSQWTETTAPDGSRQLVETGKVYLTDNFGRQKARQFVERVSSAKQLNEAVKAEESDQSALVIERLQAQLTASEEGRRADNIAAENSLLRLRISQMEWQAQSAEEKAYLLDGNSYGQMLIENEEQRKEFDKRTRELRAIVEGKGVGWQVPFKMGQHGRQQLALRYGIDHTDKKIKVHVQEIGEGNCLKVYLPLYNIEVIFACFIDSKDPNQIFVGTTLHTTLKWKKHEEAVLGPMGKWDDRVSIKERIEQHHQITTAMMAEG